MSRRTCSPCLSFQRDQWIEYRLQTQNQPCQTKARRGGVCSLSHRLFGSGGVGCEAPLVDKRRRPKTNMLVSFPSSSLLLVVHLCRCSLGSSNARVMADVADTLCRKTQWGVLRHGMSLDSIRAPSQAFFLNILLCVTCQPPGAQIILHAVAGSISTSGKVPPEPDYVPFFPPSRTVPRQGQQAFLPRNASLLPATL